VSLLRDRRNPDGDPLAFGHPEAIEALDAASASVLDLTQPGLWVCQGPSALGVFVRVPMEPNAKAAPDEPIPADPVLTDGTWSRWQTYTVEREKAKQWVRRRQYRPALLVMDQTRHLNPDDFELAVLRGDALAALGREDEARYNYREALRMRPFPASLRDRLRRKIAGASWP
jgi:hypothetical protein